MIAARPGWRLGKEQHSQGLVRGTFPRSDKYKNDLSSELGLKACVSCSEGRPPATLFIHECHVICLLPHVYHIGLVHSKRSIPHAIKFFFLLTRAWAFPKDRIYQSASLQGTRNDRHWKPDRPVFHLIIAISWPISSVTLNKK